jgi:hypothetical protein
MKFSLHIQCDATIEELAVWLRTTPELGLSPIKTRASLSDAWIDFGDEHVHLRLFESDEYDPRLVGDEDGWLYYRYILEGTGVDRQQSPEHAKSVASALLARLRDLDGEVAILSDWEDEEIDV